MYEQATNAFGRALGRLARAYEPDIDKSRDLLQEIHFALWRSFERFEERCSLRTWVYRVAHNVATSQVSRRRAVNSMQVGLGELDVTGGSEDRELLVDKQRSMELLMTLIQNLKPLDKQIILLYLDGIDGASIGEITGLTAANVGIKIHRIKEILSRRFSVKRPI